MAQPVWQTPAGSLGTIPEKVFYQVLLVAYDPDFPLLDNVYFKLIAGQLPAGIQLTDTGLITGIPYPVATIQGTPLDVAADVTSKFAIRAYTEKVVNGVTVVDRFIDQTFTITVTGQNIPNWITPAGSIGLTYDGSAFSFQFEFTDSDLPDTVFVQLAAGQLPIGTTLTPKGLLSGYLEPLVPYYQNGGFSRDGQGFSQYPFSYTANSASTNYQFTLAITDGKSSSLRSFSLFVCSRDSLTADTIDFTADNADITADETPTRVPLIVNSVPSDLGRYKTDNYYAYQFIGYDGDGDPVEFTTANDSTVYDIPPGLTLDPVTGWLYGYIPDLGLSEITYEFAIVVRKANNPSIFSNPYYFSLTLTGAVNTSVTWLTPSNLGYIVNGSVSTLAVQAVNTGGRLLQYRLKPGVYNKLPQGLQLLSTGEIAGRVSFNTFALDGGTTTFDQNRYNTPEQATTFDLKCTFTVNAYSSDGIVSSDRTFSVTVDRVYNEPYDNLYIKAMPPLSDRTMINNLIQDPNIFPPSYLYRANDPNFGVAKNVVYWHAYGLTSATYQSYVDSLVINHYWKNLVLGEIETAQALNADGTVLYEVVYSRIIDNLVNQQGQSVSKEVTLPYPIGGPDSTEITTVYPNSLINMRDQVIDTVGKISDILPRWMISKQTNGRVLGFTPAWVICYTKPGRSKQIAYNIKTQFGEILNQIDFQVDRYELDRLLSIHWDPTTQSWVPTPAATTFDLDLHYEVTAISGGVNYNIGDKLLILGNALGGISGVNDVTITVQDVSLTNAITLVNIVGTAPLFSLGDTFSAVSATTITGTGSGATFNFVVGSGSPTTFDGNSIVFEAPVDIYTNTDAFDKYLVFPRQNILV